MSVPETRTLRLERHFQIRAVETESPTDADAQAEFLRERLLLFARSCIIVLLGYYLVSNVLVRFEAATASNWMVRPDNAALFLSIGLEAALWLGLRWTYPSQRTLQVIDACGAIALCVFASLGSLFQPRLYDVRTTVLAVIFTLIARSVVIPSHALRTRQIGLGATVPVILAEWLVAVRGNAPADYSIAVEALCVALWCLGGVGLSTGASKVIYNLRQEIHTARRLGQYTLEELIGAGGMGEVYRASHAMLRRPTAVKILRPEKAGNDAINRFEQEVQLTSRLTHPNTIAIYDFGRTPDGIFYYAMEYLPGVDLRALVERFGAVPPGRAVHILRQVCGSLAEAHSAGLIHRDIKAANVILCERGGIPDVVKVVDFGLVKDTIDVSPTEANEATMIFGTPLYLSPEAIRSPATVDSRSDIYAVGVLGYFLLTGSHPFEGNDFAEICKGHLESPPPDPSSRCDHPLPADLVAVILSCLEKDRGRRPPTAAALAARLDLCACAGEWRERDARQWWRALEERRSVTGQVS